MIADKTSEEISKVGESMREYLILQVYIVSQHLYNAHTHMHTHTIFTDLGGLSQNQRLH